MDTVSVVNEPSPLRASAARLRQIAGLIWGSARDRIDRALHPWRRRRAVDRVLRMQPRSILVVCLGNICRSPYAAAALVQKLGAGNIQVDSGGFIGPGRPAPAHALRTAATLGVDLSRHRSKTLHAAMMDAYDLIFVMEPAQRKAVRLHYGVPGDRVVVLGDLDPEPISCRMIADPYGGPAAAFVECYRRIDRCLETLRAVLPITSSCHCASR